MIQRVRKINIVATAAMFVTFSVSVALVGLFGTNRYVRLSHDRVFTIQLPAPNSKASDWSSAPAGLIRSQQGSPFDLSMEMCWLGGVIIAINKTDKTISGYVIASRGVKNGVATKSSFPSSLDSHLVVRPHAPAESLVLTNDISEVWVDFVEYSDGTTWGPDETGGRQTMEAIRAGSKEAAARFSQILQEDGPGTLTDRIPEKITDPRFRTHNEIWVRNFCDGFMRVCEELQSHKNLLDYKFSANSKEQRDAALRNDFELVLHNYGDFRGESFPSHHLVNWNNAK